MIKGHIIPVGWLMAGGAVYTKFAAMFIVFFMAGITIGKGAFVNIIWMTLLTAHFRVFTFEFEYRKVVIEFCWGPAVGGMASCAI